MVKRAIPSPTRKRYCPNMPQNTAFATPCSLWTTDFQVQIFKTRIFGNDEICGGLFRFHADCQRLVPAGMGVFLHGPPAGFHLSCL